MTKAESILALARQEAARVETWADLSNYLFDADVGVISTAYPVGPERSEFMKSPEYKAIRQLINEVRKRTGFIEGMTPRNSRNFILSLPPHLHAALKAEADREGVSLGQLVVAKLSMQMDQPV